VTATDKNIVDPMLWPLVEGFPPIDVTAENLASFREAMIGMSVMPDPSTHPDVRIEEVRIPGGSSSGQKIRCLLYRPAQRVSASALLHMHGGGFVMGTVEMDAARNIELVRGTGCTVLSVDYRLAPEHPHPAGLEDCHTALLWLSGQVQGWGIAPEHIGVIGESAGGGLAAALALLARDRRSVKLACQVLIYPMMMPPAHSIDARTPDPRTGRYIWTRASNNYCWFAYLSGSSASPATIAGLASDLVGLPPAFMAVGDLDLFVHDNLSYAGRLLHAGCPVELHLYPGAIHGFDRAVEAPVTVRYSSEMMGFVARYL
jgi:acetyl esterase/lipase